MRMYVCILVPFTGSLKARDDTKYYDDYMADSCLTPTAERDVLRYINDDGKRRAGRCSGIGDSRTKLFVRGRAWYTRHLHCYIR